MPDVTGAMDLPRERELEEACGPRRGGFARCVHHLFEEQAAKFPSRSAVRCDRAELTYAELNEAANRLAARLRRRGVEPDGVVGLRVARSEWMLVGMLGILKAGAAYLPLDPVMPRDRLAWMLRDSGARVLVTRAGREECLDVGESIEVVGMDTNDTDAPFEDVPWSPEPENLVYVMYTSGSSGRPKGVCVEHRQLSNYTLGILERLGLPSSSVWATVSTIAGDLGNTVIFPALASGGCVLVVPQERLTDPEAFADLFEQERPDCLKIVPSHLEALLAGTRPAAVLPARCLILGGETARPRLVARIRELAPELPLVNHYGPTECTVGVCTGRAPRDRDPRVGSIPLGPPLANSTVHVLDAGLEPVGLWMEGEVFIGGDGVARGYLGRPDLTAERFIPDPFRGGDARLYRTGDLARRLPDGAIELIGRVDDQVKIRGFRVEPDEVAALLKEHPALRDAAVLATPDARGAIRLVAFVVGRAQRVPRISDLRAYLEGHLPEAMIPSEVRVLPGLPLTPNGKLDRQALLQVSPQSGTLVEPRTPLEREVAAVWEEVLEVERVCVHDDFFELGGHSLNASRVTSRLRSSLGVDLPIRFLFSNPTVEALADAIRQRLVERAAEDRTAELLAELDQMSEEEALRLLDEKG